MPQTAEGADVSHEMESFGGDWSGGGREARVKRHGHQREVLLKRIRRCDPVVGSMTRWTVIC